ncbi:ATP-binding protein [Peptococcaceae bacterium 1198_IL3148]
MQELTVVSGKGGTGKTSLVAALCTLAQKAVICDCDVDAANLHLLLNHQNISTKEFWGVKKAFIDPDKCIQCRKCEQLCSFDAIKGNAVNPMACEGCGLCTHICPVEAVAMVDHLAGHWYISDSVYGPFVHAKLGIAEGNSGLLVAEVRKAAKEMAEESGMPLIITDGPPGIGCPVISALSGTDMALIVTEPTASAMHDMERIVQVAQNFGCITAVCINKYDLNLENSKVIEDTARRLGVSVIGRIPYQTVMHKALVSKKPVTLLANNQVKQEISNLWCNINKLLASIK